MEKKYYTNERNAQILISLLKQYNIKKIIASPGSSNKGFVGSVQQDLWFEMYSCVDERSAAYFGLWSFCRNKRTSGVDLYGSNSFT